MVSRPLARSSNSSSHATKSEPHMSTKEEQFLQRLRATFKIEATEHLQAMSAGLLELEKTSAEAQQAACIESIFRHAHSLKGASRAVDFAGTESVCQGLESLFDAWKRGKLRPAPHQFDILHDVLDLLTKSNDATDSTQAAIDNGAALDLINLLGTQPIDDTVTQAPPADAPQPDLAASDPVLPPKATGAVPTPPSRAPTEPDPPVPSPSGPASVVSTVRISTEKLDQLLLGAEEMLAVKLTTTRRAIDLREIETSLRQWDKAWTKLQPTILELRRRTAAEATRSGNRANVSLETDLLEFAEWNSGFFQTMESRLNTLTKAVSRDQHIFGKLVDDVLADAKQLLMLPFSTVLDLFPRLVRDLGRELGKEVQLELRGGDVEMDKRILEGMKDPLIHLVRNCVDHGIETPAVRREQAKTPCATITLAVSAVEGSKVEILVSDDGGGIDLAKVKASAVKQGMVTAGEASELTEAQSLALIFQSNVSTSAILTEISGRGLGMAIVREQTEKLGGRITVENRPGAGTAFRLVLPMQLATFRGLLVRVAGQVFVLPLGCVERVARLSSDSIRTVENRETILLDECLVSLVRMHTVLGMPRPTGTTPAATADFSVVVLEAGDEPIAFMVDEVLEEQEVLVKPFAAPLVRVRHLAGATIRGSGEVVAILHAGDLMKSACHADLTPPEGEGTASADHPVSFSRRILMAEDSFTSRMFLKNILESAGHDVTTAVDGAEAWTALRTGDFDLLVSDVEMPRLNGFDLTARVRSDQKLGELPIILITALASPEDRERGIDVGASAYIVKSSFDQSNLLEAIRSLV
jgi:two-component system chemotaxis sensor kinase CheA